MGEGRTNITTLPLQNQAQVIVSQLMEIFTERFAGENRAAFGPWIWSTDNADLARAISTRPRELNEVPELCDLRTTSGYRA